MCRDQRIITTASRRSIIFLGVLGSSGVALGIWCLTSGGLSRLIEFAGAYFLILLPPIAMIETLMQRYEFGPGIVRFRKFLRWEEKIVPLNLLLDLSIHNVISVRDADDGSLVVEVTREFTRGGKLIEPLALYYRATGRSVQTNGD